MLDENVFLEYIRDTDCGGQRVGLYEGLVSLFRDGRLALIFDGLDEAGKKLVDIATYLGKGLGRSYKGRIVVSSRETLLDEALFDGARFQTLQVQPLTATMMDDVLRRRFEDPDDILAFKEQQSASENLREMGTNPLLLALQIGVFKLDDRRLPELRTDLYEKGVRMLLRRVEVDESGARNVALQAAAIVSTPSKNKKLSKAQARLQAKQDANIDAEVRVFVDVLCRMGYLLHIDMVTRDFSVGEVHEMLQDADLGDRLEDASAAWSDLVHDGRGILMCVEQNPRRLADKFDRENDIFRSTHLTFQEYFAARQCVINARESGEPSQLLKSFQIVFGLAPSPWLREVLLMVTEMLTPEEFKLLAEYYLDNDDGSGAANVRVTTMLKCRREDTTKGVGTYIKHRLSKARPVAMMASALCHPNDDLRSGALTEITEFGMAKDDVVSELLVRIRMQSSVDNPWFLRVGGIRSLGKLQLTTDEVITYLVDTGLDQAAPLLVCEEALRALKTLHAENSTLMADRLVKLLNGSTSDRAFAWNSVIRQLEVSNARVLDALAMCLSKDPHPARYLAKLRQERQPQAALELEPEPAAEMKRTPHSPERTQTRLVQARVPAPIPADETQPVPVAPPATAAREFPHLTQPEPEAPMHSAPVGSALILQAVGRVGATLLQRNGSDDVAAAVVLDMMEVIDQVLPGLMKHAKKLVSDVAFLKLLLSTLQSSSELGITLMWAIHRAASTAVMSDVESSRYDAYLCIQDFEDTLRQETSRDLMLDLLGLGDMSTDTHFFEQLMERLATPHSRFFAFSPLLHHVRAVDFSAVQASDIGDEEAEALRKTLGERLAKIDGIEALFLRKELQVGKFEVALPFWTGAIEVQAAANLS
eukprot:COSAG02_NODE_8165_length_2683_cov_1.051471_2_plen_875_part_01